MQCSARYLLIAGTCFYALTQFSCCRATLHRAGRTAICRWGAWLRRQPAARVASEATPPPPASLQHTSVNTNCPIVLQNDATRNDLHEVSVIRTGCSQSKGRNCRSSDNTRKGQVITTSCHAPRMVMSTLRLRGDDCHACTYLAKANKQ